MGATQDGIPGFLGPETSVPESDSQSQTQTNGEGESQSQTQTNGEGDSQSQTQTNSEGDSQSQAQTNGEGDSQSQAQTNGEGGSQSPDNETAAAPTETTLNRAPPTPPPPSHTPTPASPQPPPTDPPPQATSPVRPPTTAVSDPRAPSSTGSPPFSVGAGASDPPFSSQGNADAASSPAFITASVAPSQATPSNSSTQAATSSASGSKHFPVVVWVLVPVLVITALVAGFVAYRCRRRLMRTRVQQQPLDELCGNGGKSRTSMTQLLMSAPRPETQAFATEAVVPPPPPPETRTSAFRVPLSALYIPTTGARLQSNPLGSDTVTETQTAALSTGPSESYPYNQSTSQSPISSRVRPDVEPSAAEAPNEPDHAPAGAAPLMRAPTFATVDPAPPPYDWSWLPAPASRLQAAGQGAVTSRPLPRLQSTL